MEERARLSNDGNSPANKWFNLIVGGLGGVALGELLGPAALIPLVENIFDVGDYNEALNRGSLNKHMAKVTQYTQEYWTDNKDSIMTKIKDAHPGYTDQEYEQLFDLLSSPYHLKTVQPEPLEACFPNSAISDAKRLSGQPTKDCDKEYTDAYYEFYNEHEQEYKSQKVTTTKAVDDLLNSLTKIENAKEARAHRKDYLYILGITMACAVIAFVLLLVDHLLFGWF